MAKWYLILTQRFVLGIGLVLVLFNLAFSAEFKPLVLPEISKEMEMKLKKGGRIEKKISGLLEMQIQLRNSYRKQPTSERLDAMRSMGMKVVEAEIDKQMIFIHVKRKLTQSRIASLKKLGVTVYEDTWIPPLKNHPTGFVIASIPVDRLYDLARKTFILRLETAEQLLTPMNDEAAKSILANKVWEDYGYNGAGVKIAVIDSSLDTTHPDIPTPIVGLNYSEYPDNINNIINRTTGTNSGHGTHVTGSALGRGTQSSGKYKGMASGADLIFFRLEDDSENLSLAGEIAAIKAAVDTYDADIITMSVGGLDTYNDGSDEKCQAVDDAFSKGALVFISAGNEASAEQHYSGTVTANSTTGFIQVNVDSIFTAPHFRLNWFDCTETSNDLDLTIWRDDYLFGWLDVTSYFEDSLESKSNRGTESRLITYKYSYGFAYTYHLYVTNYSNNDQYFHIYSFPRPSNIPRPVTFEDADPNYTVTSPAVADYAIAVGSYVTRTNWYNYQNYYYDNGVDDMTIGAISSFSSRGPRIDGKKKPDIATPGQAIISVWDINENKSTYDKAIDNDGINDGNGPAEYLVMQGTSMACPIAAGAAALLMQARPSLKGNPSQVREALRQTASGTQDNMFGYGKMDIQAALNYVLSTTPTPSPSPTPTPTSTLTP